jgi:putative addiction module antidote
MEYRTSIRAIGNSSGMVIPKAILERYHLNAGSEVSLIETDQGILISPYDPAFEEAMEVYRDVASRYRNALRELAK